MAEASPYVLIAMSTQERGQGMRGAVEPLGLRSEVLTDVTDVLYRTRAKVPDALLLEHSLVASAPQVSLVEILRSRAGFESVPILYLGPPDSETHAERIAAGVDAYISLPTQPKVLTAHFERLLKRRKAEHAVRRKLDEAHNFEQAFKESERMKDDLIHMLVHDLKSPISSVMGLLDHAMGALDGRGDEEISDLLSVARSESQHLLSLAANILDVRRMKEGHMPYEPVQIEDLTGLAQAALGDVGSAQRDRHFGFLVREEAEQVYGDPKLLRRVLANLMANAIKHTRRGGYIDFRAWRKGDDVVLSVRDDGEGIPEADHKRIFNAFEQSRHTIHDRYDSGMGLTFCKLAVEKHGGRIWVESVVGRGSTFYFTLPSPVEVTEEESKLNVAAH